MSLWNEVPRGFMAFCSAADEELLIRATEVASVQKVGTSTILTLKNGEKFSVDDSVAEVASQINESDKSPKGIPLNV